MTGASFTLEAMLEQTACATLSSAIAAQRIAPNSGVGGSGKFHRVGAVWVFACVCVCVCVHACHMSEGVSETVSS